MLLATTIMLLVCRAPSAAVSVMWLIRAKMFVNERHPFPLRKFHTIANLCATMNAATTFIMFIIYGTKFRSEFTRVYCCMLRRITKKKTSDLKQMSEQEHYPMRELSKNDHRQQKNSIRQYMSLRTKAAHRLSPTSQHHADADKDATAQDSIVTTSTTATSINLLLPRKHLNPQRKKGDKSLSGRSSSIIRHSNNGSQCRLTLGESSVAHEHHDAKSDSLRRSYHDWVRNLMGCHWVERGDHLRRMFPCRCISVLAVWICFLLIIIIDLWLLYTHLSTE